MQNILYRTTDTYLVLAIDHQMQFTELTMSTVSWAGSFGTFFFGTKYCTFLVMFENFYVVCNIEQNMPANFKEI
jgi:hypothetical protein